MCVLILLSGRNGMVECQSGHIVHTEQLCTALHLWTSPAPAKAEGSDFPRESAIRCALCGRGRGTDFPGRPGARGPGGGRGARGQNAAQKSNFDGFLTTSVSPEL